MGRGYEEIKRRNWKKLEGLLYQTYLHCTSRIGEVSEENVPLHVLFPLPGFSPLHLPFLAWGILPFRLQLIYHVIYEILFSQHGYCHSSEHSEHTIHTLSALQSDTRV